MVVRWAADPPWLLRTDAGEVRVEPIDGPVRRTTRIVLAGLFRLEAGGRSFFWLVLCSHIDLERGLDDRIFGLFVPAKIGEKLLKLVACCPPVVRRRLGIADSRNQRVESVEKFTKAGLAPKR